MAYNKRNLLIKIINIQNIVIQEKKRGLSQKYIYNTLIKKQYYISYPTFSAYMGRNARQELECLDRKNSSLTK